MRKKKGIEKDIYLQDPVNRLALEGNSIEQIKELLGHDEDKQLEINAKEYWSVYLSAQGFPGIVRVTTIAETDVTDYSLVQKRLAYDVVIKRKLPWNKIHKVVKDMGIDQNRLEAVIFNLMPFVYKDVIAEYKQLKDLIERKCFEFNKEIKRLAPLIAQLKQRRLSSPLTEKSVFLDSLGIAISAYSRLLSFYEKINEIGHPLVKAYFADKYGFDKEMGRVSHQKHRIWNFAIIRALNIINQYCHNSICDPATCNIIHIGSIRKVAQLLKILYPTIWREDIDIIAKRIKTKYYTNLS